MNMKIIIFPYLLALLHAAILFCFLANFSIATLPPSEVEALREIAKILGKTDWDFSVDPCSRENGWATEDPKKGTENALVCSFLNANDNTSHVISITLKEQSLPGTLPPALDGLPYLQEIDLTRNFLNGSIPRGWGSSQLVNISLVGNRLTGPLPKELGNISTLEKLTVEFNQLSGLIPPELGNLTHLEKLHLTSNYFTGELPDTLAKLINLMEFRIGDNNFTGKIPHVIQSWTNLSQLFIQGSGLVGPIPQNISSLTKLTDLRISDLNGAQEPFPDLSKMESLKILILRSCNITGPLPDYLGTRSTLKTLDLSFNKLSGKIPSNYANLPKVDIFLTGNLLSGKVPDIMLKRGDGIDLSSNSLSTGFQNCLERSDGLNLFKSSSKGNTSGIIPCLRSSSCKEKVNSFHINCGGEGTTVDGNTYYEADSDPGGSSCFYPNPNDKNWAFSTIGKFMDDDRPTRNSYIAKNPSLSWNYSELYKDARLSPISLTYYGFCLQNGNYSVKLHFMEITFTAGNKYGSLGRRIFDIYIQGNQVQKDFNIANEAGGIGKSIIMTFNVSVTDATLEIRLYWAGKGTTGLPTKGVYGPIISAISANNLKPSIASRLSMGAVIGIVAAVVIFIILLLSVLWRKRFFDHKDTTEHELKGLDLQTGSFTLRQIKAATNNFDTANKIGEGGFGSVFKGILYDGTIIAVKQLSSKSQQGSREFVNEIGMISAVQHPHLVKLYGCCVEGNQLLLVYEYMENNCLARALFGPREFQLKLDWPTRYNICVGIARGLAYLHEESRLKIVHRDIKATNVLLDENLKPKISDFGLARLHEEDNTHISTKIAGTYGYMAPEYAMHGYLTDKADVYSFGIVTLEIVSGKNNTGHRPKENVMCLLDWAHVLKEKGNLMDLMDPRLGSDFDKEEAMMVIDIAFLCTNVTSALRPTMSSVVSMLDRKTLVVNKLVEDPSVSVKNTKMKRMMSEPEQISESTEGPWTGSTASGSDLYPLYLNSDYFLNRE